MINRSKYVVQLCLSGFSLETLVVDGEHVPRPVEFPDLCAMSLALGKEVKTDSSIRTQIDGMTYSFSNEDAKATFMKDPQGNLAKARAYCRREASSRH